MSEQQPLNVRFYARLVQVTLARGPFPNNDRAVPLLLGTVAQESHFLYTQQLGGGPALGYGQCEPATEADIWGNYLCYQPTLSAYFWARCCCAGPNTEALQHNMVYQILLMRTHYYRCDPDPLPEAHDIEEAAVRWKKYYNTPAGAGTEAEYVKHYNALVKPYWPIRHMAI